MPKAASQRQEFVLQLPDMGLKKEQLTALKKSFKNQLVTTLGEEWLATRIIIIRIRIIREIMQM